MLVKRTENSLVVKWWLSVNKNILFSVLVLVCIGCLMVSSTSPYVARAIGKPEDIFIQKLIVYVPIGICLLIITSFLNNRQIQKCSVVGFFGFFVLLGATLFTAKIKGSSRWINMGITIQPSEFLKPFFAVFVAMIVVRIKSLHSENNEGKNLKHIFKNFLRNKKEKNYIGLLIFFVGSVILILKMQPDYGMLFTFACIFVSELFVAGISKWFVVFSCVMGGVILWLGYMYSSHITSRIDMFLGYNHQLERGLNAIKNAGFLTGHESNLKTKVPDVHTDFIFSAIVEEFGGILATILIIFFCFMILHIFANIKKKKNEFVVLACTGITSYLAFQIIVNMASELHLIPTKGMTLPFISYGGSSFISSCIAIGIILSLLQDRNLRR